MSDLEDRLWLLKAQQETINKLYDMRLKFFEREADLKKQLEDALKRIAELSGEVK
jgi:hypothetical protein